MTFIEIKNINKTFFSEVNGEQHVLKNISLQINKGDFITIVGGNGAGKSTFLNALSGSFLLDSGSIIIDEIDVNKEKEYKRAKYISRVFQNPMQGSSSRMTVQENMAVALKRGEKRRLRKSVTKENRETFKSLLSSLNLGLEEKIDTRMEFLSGGQRQAISLLMSILKLPKLLLLDEHTAALDPKTQKKIMQLTDDIVKEKNITTLMITHNIEDALNYGNRLIILNKGEIIYDFYKEEKEKLSKKELYNLMYDLEYGD